MIKHLPINQALLEGHADFRLHKSQDVEGTTISQYVFVETMAHPKTGDITTIPFNLYVDAEHRPLAFAARGGPIGARAGFETVPLAMPPVFDE